MRSNTTAALFITFAVFITGCVTTEIVGELPASQPPYRITEIDNLSFTQEPDGGVLELHFSGEILQAGWEADRDRLYGHTFAVQYPVGARLAERKKAMQCFMQFQPVFNREKGAAAGKRFKLVFKIPLREKDVKNCVIQILMGGDSTSDFLFYHKGRYYPKGKPYTGQLPETISSARRQKGDGFTSDKFDMDKRQ
ncbi:MAG: hypothetical protein ACYS8W_13895 [Planctomycetota bacterium]|jgi:hypothetical protein